MAQEDDEAYVRENPEIEGGYGSVQELPIRPSADYSAYPFLHLKANRIELNGADWRALRGRFAAADDTVISIIHIGDSHIQAEGSTSRTRSLLQRRYGSAGRGLIIPFRLAGTNQPLDYTITSPSRFTTAKLLKQPWATEMGFTGISLRPHDAKFEFTITAKPRDGQECDFDRVKMYAKGAVPVLESVIAENGSALFNAVAYADTLDISLFEPVTSATFKFLSAGNCNIFGFELTNSMTGVEYSAIGNNGATYSTYNAIGSMGEDLKSFNPNLVIISLGANEAFGKVSDQTFYANIDLLVKDIRRNNPNAEILLITPSECQRSVTTTSTTRTRKGKRRARRTRSFQVNTNVVRLRNVMLRYGKENHIPTYDWYEVAGGAGSSSSWHDKGLLGNDRIHNTWSGYALQGSLLYDALINAIEK